YVKHLGYGVKEELIGKSIFEMTAESSRESMQKSLRTWRENGIVENQEIVFKRKDGSTFPGLLSATAIYGGDGKIVASNTVIINLTEAYKAKRQLEEANRRLIELDCLKTDFISIASHELRTPIQPILGSADLALKGRMKSEEALQVIKNQANRLRDLTNDLLDVTRIDAGKVLLRSETFSINETIRPLAEARRSNLTVGVDFVLDLESDLEVVVSGDKSRITQVISNLIDNALKFTEKGAITIKTVSRKGAKGSYVEVFVS